MRGLLVIKYGGNAIDARGADDLLLSECAALFKSGRPLVIVHGGGPQIDAALRERGIVERRIDGLRVTRPHSLGIVESALCASVNKELVRRLVAFGIPAVGICGQDAGLLRAERADARLGEVGETVHVDPALLHALIQAKYLPIVAPLALDAEHPSARLNVNADTAAGAIAGALRAEAYIVVTREGGVRRDRSDPRTCLARTNACEAQHWIADGTISDGMIVKVRSAFDALARGAGRAIIVGMGADSIARALAGVGTEIEAELRLPALAGRGQNDAQPLNPRIRPGTSAGISRARNPSPIRSPST